MIAPSLQRPAETHCRKIRDSSVLTATGRNALPKKIVTATRGCQGPGKVTFLVPVGRHKEGAITNFLAMCFCGSLSGRSYHEFSGSAFLWVAVRAELSQVFWQRVSVGRCKDGAIMNFLAMCFCGSLSGRSYHELFGNAFLWVAVRTELSRISWQRVSVGRCKDGAITNFLAKCFCWSL